MTKREPTARPTLSAPSIDYDFTCANPALVIDRLRDLHKLRNDAELSRVLGVQPPTLSKIRAGKSNFSAGLILRIHEVFGLPVADLRSMLHHS